jgi:hypothetical protein
LTGNAGALYSPDRDDGNPVARHLIRLRNLLDLPQTETLT